MSDKIEISSSELYLLVMPALNVCTAIDLRIQEHACCFELKAAEAAKDLNKLLSMCSKGANNV